MFRVRHGVARACAEAALDSSAARHAPLSYSRSQTSARRHGRVAAFAGSLSRGRPRFDGSARVGHDAECFGTGRGHDTRISPALAWLVLWRVETQLTLAAR